MWQFTWIQKLSDQISEYSSFFGQLWYVIVFVFRLIVVIGLGSSVYGDEQGNFKCSTGLVGCTQACFNEFTKISHLRFWGFQLLAVTTPIVAFHFLATYFSGQILKIKATEERLNSNENKDDFKDDRHRAYEISKMEKRRKIVGKVRTRRVHADGDLKEIPVTDKIRLAYYIGTILRLCAEGIFLYFTYTLYDYPNILCGYDTQNNFECNEQYIGGLHFLWATFPVVYPCKPPNVNSPVYITCQQHFLTYFKQDEPPPSLPCWTSRPYEKTVFMRYMNVLSVVCFILCCLEIVFIPLKFLFTQTKKRAYPTTHHMHFADFYGRSRSASRSDHGETSFTMRNSHPVDFESQQTLSYPTKRIPYYVEQELPEESPTQEKTVKRYEKRHPEYPA